MLPMLPEVMECVPIFIVSDHSDDSIHLLASFCDGVKPFPMDHGA